MTSTYSESRHTKTKTMSVRAAECVLAKWTRLTHVYVSEAPRHQTVKGLMISMPAFSKSVRLRVTTMRL